MHDEAAEDATARAAGRRLRELEILGLAAPAGPNRWSVPSDLLTQLGAKHRLAPSRHRLLVGKEPLSLADQIRYPGPVWLDRVDAGSFAPYGFGADLRVAVQARRDALRELGVALDDSGRGAALRELERRAVGEQMAARLGQAFLATTPDGFRGRVQIQAAPTGARYIVISDGSRFAAVSMTKSMRGMNGRSVAISRDSRGELVVRHDFHRGLGS